MTPQQILAHLAASGIEVEPNGETLRARPKSALTDELRDLIRRYKSDLLKVLTATREPHKDPPSYLERLRKRHSSSTGTAATHDSHHLYERWLGGIQERCAFLTLDEPEVHLALEAGMVDAATAEASVLLAYRSPRGVCGICAIPREKYDAFQVIEIMGANRWVH